MENDCDDIDDNDEYVTDGDNDGEDSISNDHHGTQTAIRARLLRLGVRKISEFQENEA